MWPWAMTCSMICASGYAEPAGLSIWATTTGVSYPDTPDAFALLMRDVLGYRRFAIHASDFGGIIAAQLGHKYADRVISLHTTAPGRPDFFGGERPWDIGGGPPPSQAPAA